MALRHTGAISNMTLKELSFFDWTLTSALLSIRAERCSRSYINQLSAELLVLIFEHACAPVATPATWWDSRAKAPDARSLIAITHVCRQWREAALQCSTLWTCIPLRAPCNTARVFSERARALPLTVHAVVAKNGFFPSAERRTLRRLLPRIDALHIQAYCPYQLKTFGDILNSATAHMGSLLVRLGGCMNHDHADLELQLFGSGDTRALKSLALDYSEGWTLPQDRFTQLTELRLFSQEEDTRMAAVGALLKLLSGMPMLEDLVLHHEDCSITPVMGHTPGSLQQVRLPRLRRLSIALWNSAATTLLFSKLSLPDDTAITLTALWDEDEDIPHIGECTEVVLQQTSGVPTSIFVCNGRSRVQIGTPYEDVCEGSLLDILDACAGDLETARVLRVESITQRCLTAHNLPLHLTVENMPALTRLSLRDYRGTIISQLAAILTQTTPLLCPNLTAITLSILAPRFLLPDLRPFLHATELRATSGNPLNRLTICTPPNSGTHPNDVSFHNMHGLRWLSFCSRDLYRGVGAEESAVAMRPDWCDIWPTDIRKLWRYEDLWRACEEAGPDADVVLQRYAGSRWLL